jgi:hypothetical protein
MSSRVVLAAVLALPLLLPTIASAQDASVDQDTQLRMETQRKRLIVRPEPPVSAAVRDAERAADEAAAARTVRDASDPLRRPPQLDYDVSSALTARNAQRGLRR